jgi:hypothetical protein
VLQNGFEHIHFQHFATSSCSSRFLLATATPGYFRASSLIQPSIPKSMNIASHLFFAFCIPESMNEA